MITAPSILSRELDTIESDKKEQEGKESRKKEEKQTRVRRHTVDIRRLMSCCATTYCATPALLSVTREIVSCLDCTGR